MLKETEKRLAEIPGWERQLEARGITFHELMTIASLVEREVVADQSVPWWLALYIIDWKRT